MEIPVLIEPLRGNGYRAKSGEPLAFTAEGANCAEALSKIREQIEQRLTVNSQIVSLQVPCENPWLKAEGVYRGDPLFDEWQKAIEEYRRQVDEDASIL